MEELLAKLVTELVRPTRVAVVRAKAHLLEMLGDGAVHKTDDLLAAVAELEGATARSVVIPQVELPEGADVRSVVTAEEPNVASLRADVTAHEALAELSAEGLVVPLGRQLPPPTPHPQFGYRTSRRRGGSVTVEAPRPTPQGELFTLTHRYRQPGLWKLAPDVFVADLEPLGLDQRTERCLNEAIDAYRRGAHQAAACLLAASVEGAWLAAAQRIRHRFRELDRTLGGDRADDVQSAVTQAFATVVPPSRTWEIVGLSQHATLLRSIRNYGADPRPGSEEGLEIYFDDQRCGLLFLETHRHLSLLSALTRACLAA